MTRALPSAKYSAIYASVVQAARMQQGWVKRDPNRWLIDIQSPEYQRYTHYWTHQEGPPPAQPSTDQPDLLVATSNTLWEPFLAGDDDPNPLGPEHEEHEEEAGDDLLLHPPFLYPYPLHITLPMPKQDWRNQLVYLVLVLQLITIAGLLLPYVLRLVLV